ncbi:MAG: (2Fe-2S) ferredoxin domain-containing protein [Deltaproteobacteria bacterium]|nr:(2Fe-2S) ferredoxin domain-containing protein [Deltaproteobacteria bacterium]
MSKVKDGLVLRICRGHQCGKHADAIEAKARETIAAEGLEDEVHIDEEACFGKCFLGPNILVERWRNGARNEKAVFAMMMNQKHADARFEHQVRAEDMPKLIRWHLRAYRAAQEEES